MLRTFFAIALLAALAVYGTNADAENRALLIAASGYPSQIGPLRGPSNDVQVIWGLLTGRGFKADNVRVLADSLSDDFAKAASVSCTRADGPACPNYSNIVRALSDLAVTAQRGDYVVLYFSGHGTQIPDLIRRDEPDGLTEGSFRSTWADGTTSNVRC